MDPYERLGRAVIGSFFAAGVATLVMANAFNSTLSSVAGWIMIGISLFLFRRPV